VQQLKSFELVALDVDSLLSAPLSGAKDSSHISTATVEEEPVRFPDATTLRVEALGYTTEISLKRNTRLFHSNYTETRQIWIDGERKPELEQPPVKLGSKHMCYYHGSARIVGQADTYTAPLNTRPDLSVPISGTKDGIVAANLCHQAFEGVVYVPVPVSNAEKQKGGDYAAQSTLETGPTKTLTLVFESALAHLSADDIETHFTMQSLHKLSAERLGEDSSPVMTTKLENLHIVYLLEDIGLEPGSCGVDTVDHSHEINPSSTEHDSSHHHYHSMNINFDATLKELRQKAKEEQAKQATQKAGLRMEAQTNANELWVELLVGNDHERYLQLGEETEADAAATINVVSALYTAANFSPKINVVLVAQVTFAIQDPWTIEKGVCAQCSEDEISVNDYLSKWNTWRSSVHAPAHDDGQLLSGYDFEKTVLGYANVGSICFPAISGGINQSYKGNPPYTGTIVAHELGHNFGCQHDSVGNPCPASGYIMNAIVSLSNAPTEFSSCSKDYVTSFITQVGYGTCLENEPTTQWAEGAVCGNGLVEEGEQCDCGQANCNSIDPCCDGSTCQFKPGASCSFGQPCCNNDCTLVPKAEEKVCRAAVDVCDVPETCDGTSGACPKDVFYGAGRPCTSELYGNGLCYKGICQSLARQCQGQQTYTGSDITYGTCPNHNSLNSGSDCGILYCRPTGFGVSTCTYFMNAGQTVVTVDGTPCGDSKLCISNVCVDANTVTTVFDWEYSDWSECTSCSEMQTRTAVCKNTETDEEVIDELCQLPQALSRLCVNPTIGCTGEAASGTIDRVSIFGISFSKVAVILLFVALVVFYFIVMGACYYYLRKDIVSEAAVEDIDEFIRRQADMLAIEKEEEQAAKALEARKHGVLGPASDHPPRRRKRKDKSHDA